MPKRWLSRNGRHNDRLIISSPQGPVLHDNQAFDFAFTNLHSQRDDSEPSLSALPHSNSDNARPITSAGPSDKPRKQLRIDVHLNRPRSSDGTLSPTVHHKPSRNRSRSEEDFIGVAFGSPGHPPMAFCNENGECSPRQIDHAFGAQGPFPDQRLQPAKWKILGNLFRTRPGLTKSRSGLLRDDHERQYDVGPRHHWHRQQAQTRNPSRVPSSVRVERPHPQELHDGIDPKTILDLQPSPVPATSNSSQPKSGYSRGQNESSVLGQQADQPGLRNAKFSNSSSSLLARRSRTLENLKSDTWLRVSTDEESDAGGQSRSARRQTTPTMSKPPSIAGLNASASSPVASKYSLFPPTATTRTDAPTARGRLERSNTSPARLSPMQQQHPSAMICPAQQRRGVARPGTTATGDLVLSSPEEHTASTTRTDKQPWSTAHSQKSSASSAPTTELEEIFFDIRSIRDSKGVEKDDHFVMTRPDSVQVSLARTRSKLNAASRTDRNSEDGSRQARIELRAKDQKQQATLKDGMVRGRTLEEEQQLRREEEKLREIEARVQREINERRQKLIAQAQKGPQIPTPVINDGRFSISTAIFDETIAAVEAMSKQTSLRTDDSSELNQSVVEGKRNLDASPSKASAEPVSGSAQQLRSKQPILSMKMLPPEPTTSPSRTVRDLQERTALRRTPTPEKAISRSEHDLLSGAGSQQGKTGKPLPMSVQAVPERAATPSSAVSSSTGRETLLSPSSQRKPLPPSSLASVTANRAVASGATMLSKLQQGELSASSVSSQVSPSSDVSKALVASRLKLNDRPIEESPTIPQSPGPGKHNPNRSTLKEKPPPVPEKDAKFIPISKFAAKSTIAKVERVGVRPTRMNRSATESALSSPLVSAPTTVTGLRQPQQAIGGSPRPVRSETMPISKSPMLSYASYKPSPRIGDTQTKGSPQIKEVMTVVQAKPAAEVSVARTVSLARKQSARVMVPGPKLQARRQEEEARQSSSAEESRAPDSATQPTRSTPPPAGLGLMMDDSPKPFEPGHRKNASSSSIAGRGPLNSNPSTPEYVIENPVDKAERERAQKAAIVEAAKARARARRRAESETREQAQKERELDNKARIEKYRESQGEGEKARWEIVDQRKMSPLLIEGHRGHKPGRSMNVVVESA